MYSLPTVFCIHSLLCVFLISLSFSPKTACPLWTCLLCLSPSLVLPPMCICLLFLNPDFLLTPFYFLCHSVTLPLDYHFSFVLIFIRIFSSIFFSSDLFLPLWQIYIPHIMVVFPFSHILRYPFSFPWLFISFMFLSQLFFLLPLLLHFVPFFVLYSYKEIFDLYIISFFCLCFIRIFLIH